VDIIKTSDKPIDRMDRLADMAHFPALVNAGATTNILITLLITWHLVPLYPQTYAPIVWTALVLLVNLTPVVLLRAASYNPTPIPPLRNMNFFRDQHRFSDWVYLAASANMAFWILLSWSVLSISYTHATLAAVLAVAFPATFSPVLLRSFSGPNSDLQN
jgi:cobalamin synthase